MQARQQNQRLVKLYPREKLLQKLRRPKQLPLRRRLFVAVIQVSNVFRFSIGGKIGYMVNNHIKFVSEGLKIKSYNIKDVNPLRYGVTARVGYKMYNLFVYYSLSTLFEKDKGTEMAPLSIGISIIPF